MHNVFFMKGKTRSDERLSAGMHGVPTAPVGRELEVGETVEVVKTGSHFYIHGY